MVDLHAHTTASDGSLTPSELVALAKSMGLRALAVTDHDTIDGIPEAIAAAGDLGIELIPGIELASEHDRGRLHVLGYWVQHDSPSLTGRLRQLKDNRSRRNELMVEKMRSLGLAITMEDVVAESGGGVVARPHMAMALVRKGIVPNVRDAFRQYLSEGAPAHVPRDKIGPREASDLIHSAGGLAVVAHPISLGLEPDEVPAEFARLKNEGLDGVECYYSRFTHEESQLFLAAAETVGLLPTGGSDYHGAARPEIMLGNVIDGAPAPYSLLERLKQAREFRYGVGAQ